MTRKKCPKCRVVFYNPSRLRCLYCDTILAVLGDDDPVDDVVAFLSGADDPVVLSNDTKPLGKAIQDINTISDREADKIISRYFKSRSFGFFYSLSRNELKMGQEFKRFFIQPFDPSFILRIPWLVLDLFESLFLHLKYQKFCPVCKWKFGHVGDRHDAHECAYNREYTLLINAILTGFIARLEPTFQAQAAAETKRGQRSAYLDLCGRKNKYEEALDHVCMWFSGAVILFVALAVLEPILRELFISMGGFEKVKIYGPDYKVIGQ